MNVMATKMMKAPPSTTTTEFLSGEGADLGPQKRVVTSMTSQEQDDLDLLLSEITIQFDDDEVQTLYVGPVAIVDDDDGNSKKVDQKGCPGQTVSKIAKVESILRPAAMPPTPTTVAPDDVTGKDAATVLLSSAAITKQTKQQLPSQPPPPPGSGTETGCVAKADGGSGEHVSQKWTVTTVVDSANDDRPHHLTAAAVVIDPKNGGNSQSGAPNGDLKKPNRRKVKTTPEKATTADTSARPTISGSSPVKPTAIISPSTKRKTSTDLLPPQQQLQEVSASERIIKRLKVTTEQDTTGPATIQEEINQLSPVLPPAVEEEQTSKKLEGNSVASEEQLATVPDTVGKELVDPDLLTPPAVVVEQKPTEKSEKEVVERKEEVDAREEDHIGKEEVSAREVVLPEENKEAVSVLPASVEAEAKKDPKGEIVANEDQPQQQEAIALEKEKISATQLEKQIVPSEERLHTVEKAPETDNPPVAQEVQEKKQTVTEIEQLPHVPVSALPEQSAVKKLEEDTVSIENEPVQEEEEEGPEGELIIPDVLPHQGGEQLLEYNPSYSKDSSPAGSDSGIENEGAEVNKVIEQSNQSQETKLELNVAVVNIPEETIDNKATAGKIQATVSEGVTKQEPKAVGHIKCAKCVMSFKKELWYKKHLMNYHNIDLSNIAHFLSNLQTLDESIQDGNGQGVEEGFEGFQLDEHSVTDKTDGEDRRRPGEEGEVDAVKRLRQDASSTPSPATLQMYPEVQLSTKPARRRKEKLILINSEEDMKIKHEYNVAMVNSEESTSGSSMSSSQPLLNSMFVVKYLEQAAMMAGGSSSGGLALPDANKENSKSSWPSKTVVDPLASDVPDGLTPYERAKIVECGTEEKRLHMCSICDTEFTEREAAQDHVNFIHKDVKRRSCPHCGRTFTQTGDLTRHVRIHTGIRPFKCPFDNCKYAFISSGDLHKHVRRHNQETNPIPKPHICATCGKDFERGYDLKRHSSMHAKDDPNFQGYNCELCGKTFARKDQYRAHTYRHIGYKPHKCVHCEKSFSDASNYAKHIKVHELDGLALFCHHCEKPFKNKMAISKHVLHCKYKTAATARKKEAKMQPPAE